MANRMNVLLTFVRGHRHYTKAWLKDMVRYEDVKFHPRTMDHKDPPIKPSKVLMVTRVKPFKGNPHWNKATLETLGFVEDENDPVFVKNTPEMCALLWKVKHLVKIVPLNLPEKLSDVDAFTEYYIHENGNVYDMGKIDPRRYNATIAHKTTRTRMETKDISEKLRLRWVKGILI